MLKYKGIHPWQRYKTSFNNNYNSLCDLAGGYICIVIPDWKIHMNVILMIDARSSLVLRPLTRSYIISIFLSSK